MADLRIAYSELMVGANHPTKPDTLNRLSLAEHNNDGTHKAPLGDFVAEHNGDGTHSKLTKVTDPWVDVRAYGAVGDGVADDTTAIQSAVNYIQGLSNGGSLYLPPGKMFKYTALTITGANITVFGGGRLLDGYVQVSPASASDLNLTFDNVMFAFTTLAAGNNPLRFKNARRVNIKNCYFDKCDKAIYIMQQDTEQHTKRLNIQGNRFVTCNYNLYSDRIASPTYKWYLGDSHFVNNICEATQITNIYGRGVDGLTVADNTFLMQNVSTNDRNIDLETVGWVNIENNKLFEAGKEAIYIQYFTKVNVNNNTVGWPGQLTQSSGIVLKDGGIPGGESQAMGMAVNNVIEAPTKHGIEVLNSNRVVTVGNHMNYVGSSAHWRGGSFPSITHYGIVYDSSSSYGVVSLNYTDNVDNSIDTSAAITYGNNIAYDPGLSALYFDYLSRALTVQAGETALNLNNMARVHCNNSTPHTVTTLTGGHVGQETTFFGYTGNTTLQNGASMKLKGGANAAIPLDGTLTLKFTGTAWWETGRSF